MMRSIIRRPALPAMLVCVLLASGCATQVIEKPIFPPFVHMQAAVAPEPKPPLDIATNPDADAAYGAQHDLWAASVSKAAGRLCRWFVRQGAKWDFCPAAPAGDN